MAKERTVIESKTYNVYKMEGLTLVLLETIEEKGKVSEKDLAKKHNVDKVILDCTAEKKITYGMSVTDFMSQAKVIEDEQQTETPNNESEVK
jgi:hypothetical protein